MYCSLHAHSSIGSIRDSTLRIDEYVDKAKQFGMTSLGISDHGSLSGIYKFYKTCKKAKIKPIIGFEAYFVFDDEDKGRNNHLCMYAKDNIGLRNLYKISSSSYINHFYRKPRVTKSLLFSNSEGLIVTAACMGGPFQQLFLMGEIDKATEEIKSFIDHFGDDFYLEIHNHSIPEEEPIREFFIKLAAELNCGIIGGVDSHYLGKGDQGTHDTFKQLAYGSVGKESDAGFDGSGYWFYSPDEYIELFGKELADTTVEIADKCNISIEHNKYHIPEFDTEGVDKFEYIKSLAYKGLTRIGKENNSEYIDRLEYELSIIHMGRLEDYFLIVADVMNWCLGNDIAIGPGRGSSAGALLCYCLGITQVDPMQYGLQFGRMLNAGRLLQYSFLEEGQW